MKITIILILIPLLLSSNKSSFDYENFLEILQAVDFKDVYDKLCEAIDNFGNIVFDEEKKNAAQMLDELIKYFIEFYKNNKEYVEKLDNLKKKLNEYGFSNNLLINGGLSFLDKTFNNILESTLHENYQTLALQNFLYSNPIYLYRLQLKTNFKFWEFWGKLRNNQIDALNKIKNRIKFLNYFKYAGNAVSAFIKAKDKISKCKNKSTNAYIVSSAQAFTNVGTNMAFGSVGSFLGSFIPIPFLGTFAGGMIGNYIGEYFNSLYDFDC
jgi:hypothetical protein